VARSGERLVGGIGETAPSTPADAVGRWLPFVEVDDVDARIALARA
jgi:hypothetical protein